MSVLFLACQFLLYISAKPTEAGVYKNQLPCFYSKAPNNKHQKPPHTSNNYKTTLIKVAINNISDFISTHQIYEQKMVHLATIPNDDETRDKIHRLQQLSLANDDGVEDNY